MKKTKRKDLIPKVCSRCGSDLLTGYTLINLPHEKRYIMLCGVCHTGLGLPPQNYTSVDRGKKYIKNFWNEEI